MQLSSNFNYLGGLQKPSFAKVSHTYKKHTFGAKSLFYLAARGAPPPLQTDLQGPSRACLFRAPQGAYKSPVLQKCPKPKENHTFWSQIIALPSPQKSRAPPADRPPEPLQIMSFTRFQLLGPLSHGGYESPVSQKSPKPT